MKIENTKDIESMKFNALIYGNSGNGKTYTASTLKGKTLVIATDPGLLTLREFDIDSISPKNWTELLEVYKMLLLDENIKKYKNVVFDGLTDANEICKEHIVKVERPSVKKDIGKVYEDILTLQDYGLLQTKMTRLISSFIKLPYNVIFTAMADERKDEKTGEVTIVPSLNGKLALNLAGYFDYVFFLGVKDTGEETERFFLTQKTEKYISKDRSGKLDRLEEPNWTNVINKSLGIVEEKKETKKKESK